MHKRNGKLARYIWTALVGAVIAFPIALYRGFSFANAARLNAWYLSDGFFVAGIMVGGVGALLWIATTGFFDMLSYGFSSLLVLFTPLRKPEEHRGFYEYKARRDERRGKVPYFVLQTGIGYCLLSAICYALYSGL